MKLSILIGITLLLSSCVTNIVVTGTVPTPLIEKMPVRVAIYYDETFKEFVHSESLYGEGKWQIELGKQNLVFFRNLMSAMFETVVEVNTPELSAEDSSNFDGIIIPRIEKYGFLTPDISGLKFFSASIHYRISLYSNENEKLTEYAVVGYGKSEPGSFNASSALGHATMLAIRDGGTRISTELKLLPEVSQWLNESRVH
ncbi:MAG: hypothetical protein JKY88_11130 [Pseudomonadales bacterium]|nr:hypothetical protein [Pseudomonadales bacterium]